MKEDVKEFEISICKECFKNRVAELELYQAVGRGNPALSVYDLSIDAEGDIIYKLQIITKNREDFNDRLLSFVNIMYGLNLKLV